MTSERRLAILTVKASTHAKAHSLTKALARDVLVKEGLYTKEGKLSHNYGGERAKPLSVAKKQA